ncbi:hypothetical protein BG015_004119, partial [Linnemannia schmuckeri]
SHISPSAGHTVNGAGGDGSIPATDGYESSSGGAATSNVNGMMVSPHGAQGFPTGTAISVNFQDGGSQDVNNNPVQALQQGGGVQEPTLEALIQALPPNWTDAKLKVHSGAVELSSLSSRHPAEIMYDIKVVVLRLGIEIRSDSDFKIKCVRRKRKSSGTPAASGSNPTGNGAAAGGAGAGSTNGGGAASLSVKSLLQGHGLHYHHNNNNNSKGGPDDTASMMSSNLSIDREAWVSARSVLGGGGGAGPMQGSGSVIGTATSTSGKKKNGIRTMLWRNSTSASLASVSSPIPSPTSPTASGSGAMSMGGGTAMVAQGSGSSTRQLSQVMNGSSLGSVSSQPHFVAVGGGSGGSSFVSTTATGHGVGQGVVDSVTADHDSAASSSALATGGEGDDARYLRPGSVVGISNSTTVTTIGATTTSQSTAVVPPLQQLQQQQVLLSTITPTTADGVSPNSTGDNTTTTNIATTVEPLYGEEAIDSGEEIRFSIELCRMKNLRGLYSVDIRRVKGNRWAYKFLYHAILNTLDLQGKGGYLAGGLVPAQMAGMTGGSSGGAGAGGSGAVPNVAMSVR